MKNLKIKNEFFNKNNSLLIAEIGQAHEGSEGLAHSFIDALVEIKCPAIKFQIHLADYESSFQDKFRVNFSYEDKTRLDYWKRIEFNEKQWARIFDHCKSKNIIVGASVFSIEALEIALKNKVDFIKVGSGDLLYDDLINKISICNLPVIVSSGLSSWIELSNICHKFKNHINSELFALLQCTTEYPVQPEKIGFNNVDLIEKKLHTLAGLSDHSGNYLTSLYALANKCSLIEFHVNFSKKMFGPDSCASITLEDVLQIINAKNYFQKLNINTDKETTEKSLASTKLKFSRSIGLKKSLRKGEVIKKENIIWRKPGGFLNKENLENIIGKRANKDLDALNLISLDDID